MLVFVLQHSYLINFDIMRFVKGKTKLISLPRTASVTFTKGNLVQIVSGLVATATAQSTKHVGIIQQSVASTDSDFATAAQQVLVRVPLEPSCLIEADVVGTLLTTSIGAQFDLQDAATVNKAGTTYKVMTCRKFIATNRGHFQLNSNIDFADASWE